MKFSIRGADWTDDRQPCEAAVRAGGKWVVEISTMDELMALCQEVKCDLVVSDGSPPSIMVYDDYIE